MTSAPLQSVRKQNRLRKVQAKSAGLGVTHRDLDSPSLTMLVVLATAGVLLYAFFLLNPSNIGDPLPYVIVVFCETFLMFQVLLALWTALSSATNPRDFSYFEAKRQLFYPTYDDLDDERASRQRFHIGDRRVSIDVFIPTYGEDPDVVEKTVVAALAMVGQHTTYLLDDGKSPVIRMLAERLGVVYLTRPTNKGAKAGNINNALENSTGDFFVIFDADFVASPEFLVETVPFFANENVAFVQTPQVYSNVRNFISRGSGFMQTVFYSLTQPGKNRFNSAFCVGTNVIFRRSAIESIGGIYEESKSEDIWTSLILHEAGFRSIYIPMILATGATPENIEDYTRQQVRWATGAFEILLRHNPFSRSRRLTIDQRLQYFGTATFYFSGITPLFLILLPPMQIYLNLTPVNPNIPFAQWVLFYSGFYVMQIIVAFYTIGSFTWQTLLLATVSFPIYTRAFFNALFKRDRAWNVTGSAGTANSPFNYLVPQIVIFVFLFATSAVGIWKAQWTGEFSIALAWNLFNTTALALFIGIACHEQLGIFKERRSIRAAKRRSTHIESFNFAMSATPVIQLKSIEEHE